MKEQTVLIEGTITPESVLNLCAQLEGANLESGDKVTVMIDSEGGYVDSGLILAKCIEGLQASGIICESVAGGKVWSAAMLPFLACNSRKMGSAGSFVIHRVAVPVEENAELDMADLSGLQDMVWRDTDVIDSFYRNHGVAENACRALWEGDDLLVSNELEALGYGIITSSDIVGSPLNMRWNNIVINKRVASKKMVCKATPCIINFKSKNEMDEKKFEEKFAEIENRLNAKFDEMGTKILDALKNKSKNDEDEEPEPMNAEAMTEEELKEIGKFMRKTPAEVVGQDEIKWLAHPSEDVEKDHYVMPITKDGKAIMLPEGDYEAKIDGEDFMIHSTGRDMYLHGRGTENFEEVKEKEVKVENEEKKEVEVKAKKTNAPMNRRNPVPTDNTFKKYWEMARNCGKGGVGVKSIKK